MPEGGKCHTNKPSRSRTPIAVGKQKREEERGRGEEGGGIIPRCRIASIRERFGVTVPVDIDVDRGERVMRSILILVCNKDQLGWVIQ